MTTVVVAFPTYISKATVEEKQSMDNPSKYQEYVEHPRYGQGPRVTGLNPSPSDPNVHLHWNTTSLAEKYCRFGGEVAFSIEIAWYTPTEPRLARIPNTAIEADPKELVHVFHAVTHYFDLERVCADCEKPFIFFAEQQKCWYEVLKLRFEVDCIRCHSCRKKKRDRARLLKRYESLIHSEHKSEVELLELASCCVQLVEQGLATPRRLQFARMILKQININSSIRQSHEYVDLFTRSQC